MAAKRARIKHAVVLCVSIAMFVAVAGQSGIAQANTHSGALCQQATVNGNATGPTFGLPQGSTGEINTPVYYPQGMTAFSPADVVVPVSAGPVISDWPGARQFSEPKYQYINRFDVNQLFQPAPDPNPTEQFVDYPFPWRPLEQQAEDDVRSMLQLPPDTPVGETQRSMVRAAMFAHLMQLAKKQPFDPAAPTDTGNRTSVEQVEYYALADKVAEARVWGAQRARAIFDVYQTAPDSKAQEIEAIFGFSDTPTSGQFLAAGDAEVYQGLASPEASLATQDTVHSLALIDALANDSSLPAGGALPSDLGSGGADKFIGDLAPGIVSQIVGTLAELGLPEVEALGAATLADNAIDTGHTLASPDGGSTSTLAQTQLFIEELSTFIGPLGLAVPGVDTVLLVLQLALYFAHVAEKANELDQMPSEFTQDGLDAAKTLPDVHALASDDGGMRQLFMAFMAQTLTQVTDDMINSSNVNLGQDFLLGRSHEDQQSMYQFVSDADFARCRAAALASQGQPASAPGDARFDVTSPSGQTTETGTVGENGTAPLLTWETGTSNGRSTADGYYDVRAYPQAALDTSQPLSYDHREMIGFSLGSRGFTTKVESNTGYRYPVQLPGQTLTVSDPGVASPGDWRDSPDVPFIGPDGNDWLAYPVGNTFVALRQWQPIAGNAVDALPLVNHEVSGGGLGQNVFQWRCYDSSFDSAEIPEAYITRLGREQADATIEANGAESEGGLRCLVGDGTHFTTDLQAGGTIQVGSEVRVVSSVIDDTHAVMTTGWDGEPIAFGRPISGAKINTCQSDYYGCLTQYEFAAPKDSGFTFSTSDIGRNIIVQSGLDQGRYTITDVPTCCSDAANAHKVVRVSRWFSTPDTNATFTMTTDPMNYFEQEKPKISLASHPDMSHCASSWSADLSSGCVVSDTLQYQSADHSIWSAQAVTGLAITTQPDDQIVVSGQTAKFTAAANSSQLPSVKWQVSTDGGTTFTDVPGATSSSLSFATQASQSGNLYRAVFTNSAGTATTDAASVTVQAGEAGLPAGWPVVTAQPADQTVVSGQPATLVSTASGNAPMAVQWQVSTDGGANFTNIPGATATTLSFIAQQSQSGNEYQAHFKNTVFTSTVTLTGSATSNPATLTVTTPPTVVVQPTDRSVIAGRAVTFTASASGSPVPDVRWQVSTDGGANFTDIHGANDPTLSFIARQSDSGNRYRSVFTSDVGTATTNVAMLTVSSPPLVATQPGDQKVLDGQTATFDATAEGTPAPTVQWQVSTDGGASFTNVPGATSTTLSFNASVSQSGSQYRAVFTSPAGVTYSLSALLTVSTKPLITLQPTDQSVLKGTTVTFTTAATGTPTPTVQWLVSTNGVSYSPIAGATSTTLSFTAQQSQSGNQYVAIFHNAGGNATTNVATLTVSTPPLVATQPGDQKVLDGQPASFTATAVGTPAPTVQWQVSTDGGTTFTNLPGAISTGLSFNASLSQSGYQYQAVFTNSGGTATSLPATLTVSTAPVITLQPTDQSAVAGQAATFTAAAAGSPTPTVQWLVSTDGASYSPIAGATSTTLSFTVQQSQSGNQYVAIFHNAGGNATTNVAALTVSSPPQVTTQPSDQSVLVGQTATFTASASGTPSPTVQWQVSTDGGTTFTDLPGATSKTLSFAAAQSQSGYRYRLVFTSPAGSVTSHTATLSVHTPPSITSASTTSFAIGTAGSFPVTASGVPLPSLAKSGSLPAGVNLVDNGNGTASISGTPAAGSAGTYPITITAHNGFGSDATQVFTLKVSLRQVTLTYTGGTSGQWSDPATMQATLVDSATGIPVGGRTITFALGGQASVSGVTTSTAPAGIAGASQILKVDPGPTTVTASFGGDQTYASASTTTVFTVNKESATVQISSSDPHSLTVTSSGTGPAFTLSASARETPDGSPGDITKIQSVVFNLTPVGGGSSVTCTAAGSTLVLNTSNQVLAATCKFGAGVPIGIYDVNVKVGANPYYAGSSDDVLSVFDPSAKAATGSGAVTNGMPANTSASFSFNVHYNSSGGAVGSFIYVVTRTQNGLPVEQHVLKGNSMSKLAISSTKLPYTGAITGKATLDGVGNYQFSLAAQDTSGTVADGDLYGQSVTPPNGAPALPLGMTIAPQVKIQAGGDINIR